jgi:hypothetical protein
MPIYFMSAFILSKWVIARLDKIRRGSYGMDTKKSKSTKDRLLSRMEDYNTAKVAGWFGGTWFRASEQITHVKLDVAVGIAQSCMVERSYNCNWPACKTMGDAKYFKIMVGYQRPSTNIQNLSPISTRKRHTNPILARWLAPRAA